MDKELIRIIIIATGLVAIIAMLIWGYLRNRQINSDMSIFDDGDDDHRPSDASAYETEDDDLAFAPRPDDYRYNVNAAQPHDVNVEPRFQAVEKALFQSQPEPKPAFEEIKINAAAKQAARQLFPNVVQFSIVAKNDSGFNGIDLLEVFQMVGLEYGSMKIFERLDINRMVDFGVASMVNPGTFPVGNMDTFYTPGITFFMQPKELPDPLLVFDDLVRTINLVAKELDGIKWDAERKPLNEFTIKQLRQSLQPAA